MQIAFQLIEPDPHNRKLNHNRKLKDRKKWNRFWL